MSDNNPYFPLATRRQAIQSLISAATVWAAPRLWAQSAHDIAKNDGRLIVVLLRGAYDGLSAFVPHGDSNYYRLRPNIAIAPPDGTAQTTLALDVTFGLHPSLAALQPLWHQGVLSVVPACGSPDATRSHFDAQRYLELGVPGQAGGSSGWMNTLAGLYQRTENVLLGVGESNPQILAGPAGVKLVPRGQAATKQGVLGNERTRQAVMNLYAGTDNLSHAFRVGAQSRMETAQTLSEAMNDPSMNSKEMLAANNGAGAAQGLLLDAQHLGTLMRQNSHFRLGFLSAGGWDTHANQGAVTGTLAKNLELLAVALVQLRRDFSAPNDVVVVLSEFGRTTAENGTRGTDHGHGNALWLMGNKVNGGRWHGAWSGLEQGNLHEGRDLPVLNDYRGVLAQVLSATHGLSGQQINHIFPGFLWDQSLNGLFRS